MFFRGFGVLMQVNRILKVAKPNIVVMKLLAGGHKKETKVQDV